MQKILPDQTVVFFQPIDRTCWR